MKLAADPAKDPLVRAGAPRINFFSCSFFLDFGGK
jgi:hypothetical protein